MERIDILTWVVLFLGFLFLVAMIVYLFKTRHERGAIKRYNNDDDSLTLKEHNWRNFKNTSWTEKNN